VKPRSSRNKTIQLSVEEKSYFGKKILKESSSYTERKIENQVLCGDSIKVLPQLPKEFIDLVVTDPPYNMTKIYAGEKFSKTNAEEYELWLRSWIEPLIPLLKPNASLYVCTEWQCSSTVEKVLRDYFYVRNRITWEREKGRGAQHNWKNAAEDIWFCTVSNDYYFNADAVRLKRKVIAPYRHVNGEPKDWADEGDEKFRLTAPSNLWTDISVPFWSMPENTEHPTQKPEKLIAKLILASSKEGDFVFDPFLGSGTTAVTAKKLSRRFAGIEREKDYALLALKRLQTAEKQPEIQGFKDGCFWERNTRPL
jgi:site-specific DNA-methyltransferase (adenine-specific)